MNARVRGADKTGHRNTQMGNECYGMASEGPAIDSSNRKTLQLMVIAESEGQTGGQVGWTAPKGHFYLTGVWVTVHPKQQHNRPKNNSPPRTRPRSTSPPESSRRQSNPRRGPALGAISPEQSNWRRHRSPPRARDDSRQRQPQRDAPGRKSRAT